MSDAIRHFRTFHGKSVNVLVECSYWCNISKTVQAAFFYQEKACPGLAPPDQLDSTSPAEEPQLLGDKVILLYPPRPSKCPLCSWTCVGTRADANGTPTTSVADGIISHLYTHHNGIKATRFWRCSKCLVLGEGMALHHHHRYPIEDVDNDHPDEARLSSTDYPSDSTTSIGSPSPSCYPAQPVASLNLEDTIPPVILSNGEDTTSPIQSTHSLVAIDEPPSEGSSNSNDASSRPDPTPPKGEFQLFFPHLFIYFLTLSFIFLVTRGRLVF
jgi:hypothetical protein